jgi:hypothetical protein
MYLCHEQHPQTMDSIHGTMLRPDWRTLLAAFVSGSCDRWHHQEAYVLRPGSYEAAQGGARGRGQGEAQDGLRPGFDRRCRGDVIHVLRGGQGLVSSQPWACVSVQCQP